MSNNKQPEEKPAVGPAIEPPLAEELAVANNSRFDQATPQSVLLAVLNSANTVARNAPSNDIRAAFITFQKELRQAFGV